MAEDLSLSTAVRSNQQSLRNAAELMARAGNTARTPAVSNAVSGQSGAGQQSSALPLMPDRSAVKQDLARGIGALTKAMDAAGGITSLVEQMQKLVQGAMDGGTTTDFAATFNDLRKQVDKAAASGDYLGVNLVSGTSQSLTVSASSDGSMTITLTSVSFTAVGLNIGEAPTGSGAPSNDWLQSTADALTSALGTLNEHAQTMGANLDQLQSALSGGGPGGAAVSAEGANLLALQTRQQLGNQSLSFSGQFEQSVLGLFRS